MLQSSFGSMESSKLDNARSYSFSRESRFPSYDEVRHSFSNPTANGKYDVPGVGSYQAPSALGKQAESTKLSHSGSRFGSSERGITGIYLSKEHAERAARIPGAGQYEAPPSLGAQPLSKKKTLP